MLSFFLSFLFSISLSIDNPYKDSLVYVQQSYVAEVQSSINAHPDQATLLKKFQNVPVFYWIDSMARIPNVTAVLDGALAVAKNSSKPVVAQIIIYDVPNRDCAAAASNGEIHCGNTECSDGIQTYKTDYIDKIYAILSQPKYETLTIVALIEPDSLPNLATNMNKYNCTQTTYNAYTTAIPYAIKKLSSLKNVVQYVDAAHGGWLGWPNNMQTFVTIIRQVLESAGGVDIIRGFASNTANYQPLGSVTSTSDPCELKKQYNNCLNEALYIQFMDQQMRSNGIIGKGYITDTSRNGVPDCRKDENEDCQDGYGPGHPCCQWCNINNSGFGQFPSSDTAITGIPELIDAFVWAKVPGESDGTSNKSASNYDFHCGSDESVQGAPQAGQWFDKFFVMLANNAPNQETKN